MTYETTIHHGEMLTREADKRRLFTLRVSTNADKVRAILENHPEGLAVSNVRTSVGLSPANTKAALAELQRAGVAEIAEIQAANGQTYNRWRIIPTVPSLMENDPEDDPD